MKPLLAQLFYLGTCLAASVVPLLHHHAEMGLPARRINWPEDYDGRPLTRLPLTPLEDRFHASFPGEVALFCDGERHYICRWAVTATRQLHPSADCFRGAGYRLDSSAPVTDELGRRWSRFLGDRAGQTVEVRERIISTKTTDNWTDVSAWYWHALLHPERGPWLAISVVTNIR